MSKIAEGMRTSGRDEASGDTVPAFLVDGMLGRLARWLRVFGFDTWYVRGMATRDPARIRKGTGRILLTRDVARVRHLVPGTYLLIEHDRWEAQVEQVVQALGLALSRERCFSRCVRCNDLLKEADPATVRKNVPDHIAAVHSRFRRCPSCARVYWPGTHRSGMMLHMERVMPVTPLPEAFRVKEAALGTLRVVAGSARGRRLIVPREGCVRPTIDRIREALFSILGGFLPGCAVMDLFSGSGALGIEALSRGAGQAVFVEDNPLCVRTIRENLARCGFSSGHVVWQCRLPEGLPALGRRVGWKTDIVLMDPPYGWDGLEALLRGLHRCSLLAKRATIVLEHFHKDDFSNVPAVFSVGERRRYGDTVLTFFHYLGGEPGYGKR